MAKEPPDLVLVLLREIRAKQEEHSTRFDQLENRIRNIEKQSDDVSKVVTYALGQATEVKFRQTRQESRLDDLFQQVEKLLHPEEPL